MNVSLQVFHGPSRYAPFPAVVVFFSTINHPALPVSALEATWRLINKTPLWEGSAPSGDRSITDVACRLAQHLQHPDNLDAAQILSGGELSHGAAFVALRFTDSSACALVLKTSVELAEGIFLAAAGDTTRLNAIAGKLRVLKMNLQALLPQSPIIRTLIQEARRRNIPVYPVAESSRIWLFGQGARGFHFFEAANDRDSFTGMLLQKDKTLSNRLVKRLGFPGVTHAIAKHKEMAISIANSLGFPVVVKPIASGKGIGISAFVVDNHELEVAFAKAAEFSPQGVIVERHIVGNDHRLAVFGGKLTWVAARFPGSVVGDGISSIGALIELENHRRQKNASAAGDGLSQIVPDDDMRLHLLKQGYTPASVLPKGATAFLRSVANLSKGGSIEDVSEHIHPDNIEMAEAIARGFRMDTLGIDFMTPDIKRSWREVPCGVIEVNGTPGIFFDARARKILLAKFPFKDSGRIPCVLLLDAPTGMASRISSYLTQQGRKVGQLGRDETALSGQPRCSANQPLHERIQALIFDPACEALVIEHSADSLSQSGLPLDHFHCVLSFQPLNEECLSLLQACSNNIHQNLMAAGPIEQLVEDGLMHDGH
jgi:cyanophycin synthetase